jgi:hypothetical protein
MVAADHVEEIEAQMLASVDGTKGPMPWLRV